MLTELTDSLMKADQMLKAVYAIASILSYAPSRNRENRPDPVTAAYDSLNLQPSSEAVLLAAEAALCVIMAHDLGYRVRE